MPLDPSNADLIRAHAAAEDKEGIRAVTFGLCWPNDSKLTSDLNVELQSGETLAAAADRLDLRWNPGWLLEAGYDAKDEAGNSLRSAPSTTPGPITWEPEVRICRVDDQTADTVSGPRRSRRLAAEVALHALWADAVRRLGLDFSDRPETMDGNTRGALFRDILVCFLSESLPSDWQVKYEVPLAHIRGLHMRKEVGGRKSDIVVIDEAGRLVAVISSKWTWRSDRGTEAAQIVALSRFRPDVPYAVATAEFPRVATVARESIEDRAYHVCPEWAGAWYATRQSGNPRTGMPELADLREAGKAMAQAIVLSDLHQLATDLKASRKYL